MEERMADRPERVEQLGENELIRDIVLDTVIKYGKSKIAELLSVNPGPAIEEKEQKAEKDLTES